MWSRSNSCRPAIDPADPMGEARIKRIAVIGGGIAVLVRDGFRLDIQIVKHLDVVGDESDWRDDHVLHAVARRGAERQADIRLELRLPPAAAAALGPGA